MSPCACCPSHFDQCGLCDEDSRRPALEARLARRRRELHARIRKAGGHGPSADSAVEAAAGTMLHCWRGKQVDEQSVDLAAAMILLGSAMALLETIAPLSTSPIAQRPAAQNLGDGSTDSSDLTSGRLPTMADGATPRPYARLMCPSCSCTNWTPEARCWRCNRHFYVCGVEGNTAPYRFSLEYEVQPAYTTAEALAEVERMLITVATAIDAGDVLWPHQILEAASNIWGECGCGAWPTERHREDVCGGRDDFFNRPVYGGLWIGNTSILTALQWNVQDLAGLFEGGRDLKAVSSLSRPMRSIQRRLSELAALSQLQAPQLDAFREADG